STKNHFCQEHSPEEALCCISGCKEKARRGHRSCAVEAHAKLEERYVAKGKAAFQLQERLSRARGRHPDNSTPISIPGDEDGDTEDVEAALVDDNGSFVPPEAATRDKPLSHVKGVFGRKRTHNEQLLVYPCGVIAARETFFHSESLPSVVHFFKNTYSSGISPNHLVFDNNCGLAKHVKGKDSAFDNVGLPVDVFHFKSKHRLTDEYCQLYCNPASFPELMTDDRSGWWFNTSI
ncbi:hypothetical protein V5O48_018989, partial [Marasmius crinis-equi]